MNRLTAWILVLACAAATAHGQDAASNARKLLEDKKYEEAAKAYDALVDAEPNNREYVIGLATAQLWVGDFRASESTVGAVLETSPDDLDALWLQAQALFYQADELRGAEVPSNLAIRGRFNDAESISTRILELDSSRDDVVLFRGNTRFWLENLDGAAEDYLAVLSRDPQNADLLFTMGDLDARYRKRYPEAIDYLKQALAQRADFFEAHRSLGLAYTGSGDMDAAIRSYTEALRLQPNDPEIFAALWGLFGKQQQHEEALKVYEAILQASPENFTAHWHRAYIFKEQSRVREAADEVRAVIAIRPEWTDAHNFLASLHVLQGDNEAAIQEWKIVLESDPQNQEATEGLLGLARSAGEAKDYEKALAAFDELVKLFPEDSTVRADRALTLYNMNRINDAIKGYEDAIRLDPFDSQLLNDFGLLYQGTKDFPKAIEMFMKAIDLDKNIDALENYAVLQFKLNEIAKATNKFQEILWLDGTRERSLKYYLECRRILDHERVRSTSKRKQ